VARIGCFAVAFGPWRKPLVEGGPGPVNREALDRVFHVEQRDLTNKLDITIACFICKTKQRVGSLYLLLSCQWLSQKWNLKFEFDPRFQFPFWTKLGFF
jgi:hypothetical protein